MKYVPSRSLPLSVIWYSHLNNTINSIVEIYGKTGEEKMLENEINFLRS